MTAAPPSLSVILPASNEGAFIGRCLDALLASKDDTRAAAASEVIVVANACSDDTAEIARARAATAAARGWRLHVVETDRPGKLNALNLGEASARNGIRVYLDADVIVSPPLLGQLAQALAVPEPAWASGRPVIAPARSSVTRAYARVWSRLPFMTDGVPGFGIFAVNVAGRARWGAFPEIISDDTFVRLHFSPNERIGVPAHYEWPMVEGLRRLVRVRRRQDAGVREVLERFPELNVNHRAHRPVARRLAAMLARDPVGIGVYALVSLLVRFSRTDARGWARGR